MMRVFIFLLISVFQVFLASSVEDFNWTSTDSVFFTDKVRATNKNKKSIIFTRNGIKPFTQLIVSWNAFRPEQGYYSFSAQVRDAETKTWGSWHMMADWGANVQRSYAQKSDGFSSYVHVRLEIDANKCADGFRIKVEPHEKASLALLYGLSAATSDFNLFKIESDVAAIEKMETVIISDVPQIAQFTIDYEDKHRICSPVSCAMVVEHLTGEKQNPLDFALRVFDEGLSIYGSWSCNTAHAFDRCKGIAYFCVKRGNSFSDLHKQLVKGIPVIVSVRGTLPGALKSFPNGHLMVVVGWDQEKREVLCNDPAAESYDEVLKRYALEPFLRAWERSHRLMYSVDLVGNNFIKKHII